MIYEVVIGNTSIWQGKADTGIDALAEARADNPDADADEMFVQTLREA